MGTNFYAKHIPSEQEYVDMQEALTNRQLDKLQELINNAKKSYHIGKRSRGWAFAFQASESQERTYYENDEACVPWEDNLESLKAYLNREDVQIEDEYGEVFTPEQFWNKEVGESLYVHSSGDKQYDSHESYYKRTHDRNYYDRYEKVKDGIRWTYCWFA